MESGDKRFEKEVSFRVRSDCSPAGRGNQLANVETLKNISKETLRGLDIQLHSLDTYYLTVYGTGCYRMYLPSLIKKRRIGFQANVLGSADVYVTIRVRKEGGEYFLWESGWTHIYVRERKAELERVLVLSHPYTQIGKTLSAEATVKGLSNQCCLLLEFWVEPPSGKSEKQATTESKELSSGEEARYTTEFTPQRSGALHDIRVFIRWMAKNRPQDKLHLRSKTIATTKPTGSPTPFFCQHKLKRDTKTLRNQQWRQTPKALMMTQSGISTHDDKERGIMLNLKEVNELEKGTS